MSALLTLLFQVTTPHTPAPGMAPAVHHTPAGTGLEWMVLASIVLPALLLIGIVLAGRRRV